MSSSDKSRACQLSQSVFTLRQARLTASLPTLPPNRPASARRTRARVGAGKVRIGDNRLGPFGQPLVGLDGLAPPFLLTAIPIEQRTRGSETVSAPKVPTSCRCRWPLR